MTARAAREFIRSRTRRSSPAGWTDRYLLGAAVVIALALALAPLRAVAAALSGSQPASVPTGLALIGLAAVAAMAALRWLGPVVMAAPDVTWLLLSPLDRRAVLAKPALRSLFLLSGTASVAGVAALAAVGARDAIAARMVLAVLLAVALAAAGWALAVHVQATEHRPRLLRLLPVLGIAAAPAFLLTRAPLALNAGGTLAATVLAAGLGLTVASSLRRFPAPAVVTASLRLGTALDATVGLQPSDFTRAAEDRYWRGRRLRSRPWPRLPVALLLAWPDWRMLGRRRARLALIAASAAIPAALSGAGTGAVVVLFGLSLAVAAAGTTTLRREPRAPMTRRVRIARTLLPAVLAAAWLPAALALGFDPQHTAVGLAAAPVIAVAAMRMARRGPIDHSSAPIVMPMSGSWIPTGWLIWSYSGLDVAVAGCLPMLLALFGAGLPPAAALAGQLVASATVLGVWCAKR